MIAAAQMLRAATATDRAYASSILLGRAAVPCTPKSSLTLTS